MKQIKTSVYKLIFEQFSVSEDDITDETGPGDLPKWDSIGQLRLILSLEEEFGIQLSVDDIMKINSIKDIVKVIGKYKSGVSELSKGQKPVPSTDFHPVRVPATTYWGHGSLSVIGNIVHGRVAFITGLSGYAKDMGKRVSKMLPEHIGFKVFQRQGREPYHNNIITLSEELQSFLPEHIVAIGGGSTIDMAKLTWLLYEKPGFELNEVNLYKDLKLRDKAIFTAVPTTFGSGSEVSSAAAFSEPNKTGKCIVVSHEFLPDQLILDPSLGQSASLSTIYASAFDALTHAIEGYVSIVNHPLLASSAIMAIKNILAVLGKIKSSGVTQDVLETLCYAAYNAGIVQNHCSVGLTHSLAHQMGGFGIGHGVANSLFLVPVINCNAAKTDIYTKLMSEMGFSTLNDFIDNVNRLLSEAKLYPDKGVIDDIVSNKSLIVEGAMDDITFRTNPAVLDKSAVELVFDQAINNLPS
jgi:acyl carrier protein|tara:strand:+ start:1953 stop:3356 length:1404 start_codon:yes stop_codon:yes gene_type:complete